MICMTQIWIPLNGNTEACILKVWVVEYWSLPWIETLEWLLIEIQTIINQDFINTSVDTRSTLHWFLGWHLIDTSSIPWWTLNQHLSQQLVRGWLIFNWCIWVNEHSANVSTSCWSCVAPRVLIGVSIDTLETVGALSTQDAKTLWDLVIVTSHFWW